MTALVLSLLALALSLASVVLAVKTARLRRRIDAHLAGRRGEILEPRRRIAVYTVPAHRPRLEVCRFPWGCVVLAIPLGHRALCIQWNDHDNRVTSVEGNR